MMKQWSSRSLSYLLLILLSLTSPSFAEKIQDSPSPPPIKIGSSTALEGAAKILGEEMSLGEQVYFDKINAEGGVGGRELKLIVYNDSYEPSQTAINMRKLITEDQVLAIIGNVGTPTAVVSIPIIEELKILFYGSYAGADLLHTTPPNRYIFNFRASYANETATMIHGLLKAGIKPDEIAFFSQSDAFGDSGYLSAVNSLKKEGYQDADKLAHGRFLRNSLNVEEGLAEILEAKKTPKAIIIVAPYRPAARFIKLAIQDLPKTIFLNVSFVGGDILAKELGSVGNNQVIVTQVVPNYNSNLPAVKEYRESLKKYAKNSQPGYISLEGYLAAKLFVIALQHAAKANLLNREGIITAMEGLRNVDIGIGMPISYDKNDHQAIHTVWPTILRDGKLEPFEWTDLRQSLENLWKGY